MNARATDESAEELIQWPLSYRRRHIQPKPKWWSYTLYRGLDDEKVQIFYSKDRDRSEELAKKFLSEPVVGFDMEWPCHPKNKSRLQEKIGLIQVASENQIALFHIGLHTGTTTAEIIAPSLKKLIESPAIAKTGVGILSADFSRLRNFFGLKPQGAFELSHFDRLVKFSQKPELLTTKMVALKYQVAEHLGLPLSKGPVRTSNWSKPLSPQQMEYAASDAYAGFMLFHCMNAKRARLKPMPPLPIFAELYPRDKKGEKGFAPIRALLLHPTEEGGGFTVAAEFFSSTTDEDANKIIETDAGTGATTAPSRSGPTDSKGTANESKAGVTEESLNHNAQSVYDQLVQQRLNLADAEGLPPFLIASNAVLWGLALQMPKNEEELLKVKGIGKVSAAKYGGVWLTAITRGEDASVEANIGSNLSKTNANACAGHPTTPSRRSRGRRVVHEDPGSLPPACDPPVQHKPSLHTGLSFTFEKSTIDADATAEESNGSSNIDRPRMGTPPSLKRKRAVEQTSIKDYASVSVESTSLSPASKIYRNKLLAFSRRTARKLGHPVGAPPIVSEATLDRIAATTPRTFEQLRSIVGIDSFLRACDDAQINLLQNVIKFAPARP